MSAEGRKVFVKSMVNYEVGLVIPELRFTRYFTNEGDQKYIDFDVLYEGINSTGVRTVFEEGILYIENEQDRIDLGLQEEGEKEKFRVFNRNQILKLLKIDSAATLDETLSTLPTEQKIRFANIAIEEKFTDYDKCQIIKKYSGIDVINSVKMNEE